MVRMAAMNCDDGPHRYRLIPVVVEAIQLLPSNSEQAAIWCGGTIVEEIDPETKERKVAMNVPTINGVIRVGEGDFVFKNQQNRICVMPKKQFLLRYEIVDE